MSADKVFTVGSLFSGIGGLELGLEMTGRFKTVWQVEQSEYCRKVLRKHWPDAIQFEDVRNVGRENLPAVDVICGGFPCQDISTAGRKAGILPHTRSGLWFEYARIVRELRPQYIIVENVSALLVRGLDVVLGELAEIGYDAEWSMLSAADVGAPHLRQRIFVVAYAQCERLQGSHNTRSRKRLGITRDEPSRSSAAGESRTLANSAESRLEGFVRAFHEGDGDRPTDGGEAMAHPISRRQPRQGQPQYTGNQTAHREGQASDAVDVSLGNQWSVEPNVGRVANGVPSRVDRLTALGNAVVPQCARVIGEWLLEIDRELSEESAA